MALGLETVSSMGRQKHTDDTSTEGNCLSSKYVLDGIPLNPIPVHSDWSRHRHVTQVDLL